MKQVICQNLKSNNEAKDEELIRIHLLVSVHPNNEATFHNNCTDGDYDILILNPQCKESIALIRQITIIRPKIRSEANK